MSCVKHSIWVPVAVLLALSLTLVSCKKDPEGGGGPGVTLSITTDTPSISRDKNEIFLRVKASGKWTGSLEYADESASGWASLSPYSGEGERAIVFTAQPNNGEEARKVRVVITQEEETASVLITQAGTKSEPAGPAGGWLELPETPGGIRKLLVHDMEGDPYVSQAVSGIRNWSCWWDPEEHLSIWVAYPLNNALKGSGSRSNAWGVLDPCIPASEQPNTYYTYGGGWTRGHQIPSADRLKTVKANESTFYPTNMTPQDYDFNSGIWAALEGAVRGYASKSDTLYVVTGCDISTNIGYSGNNTGFRVKAPGAYWKAVLSYQKSRSVYGGFLGCAFYLPHDTTISNGAYISYIMSIDDLEKKIGIDLFVNLPDKIGAENAVKLEALSPGDFWR